MKIYSEHSYWWLLLIALLSFGIAYLQYLYKIKSTIFSRQTRILLFIIRSILLFIIGLLLMDFYSRFIKNDYIKPAVILAIDNSQSMIASKDSAEVKKFIKNNLPQLISHLSEKFDVQTITFGEKIHFNPDSIIFNDFKTNGENIFSETQQILGNKPISAMVMITDGIFNEGVHPVSLTNNVDFSIYTIGTGDTTIYKDIAVKKILHNKNVFIGNDFIVEVLLHTAHINNEKVKISISENNKELLSKELIINSPNENITSLQFQLNAEKGGHHTYKVTASVVKDEKNTQNNVAYFVINVIENKLKVLFLYSAPHPDISAIRQSLHQSEQYQTEVFSEQTFNKNINDYDVVVYHSPESNSPLFSKCLQSNIPMFIITTHLTPLQNKFLNITQNLPQQTNEIECTLNTSFSTFSTNDEYKEIVNQLPIIIAPYGNYAPAGEYQVLYYQKINQVLTELPLFFFTQTTNGKYAVFLGDGLWKWKMKNFQIKQNTEWFNHLITQSIRYLAIKRDKTPFKVYMPATINENEPLQVSAELYNEIMQPITEPDVFLILKDSSNHEYKFVFSKSSNNYFLNAGILPSGEYIYKAYTQYQSKEYIQTGKLHILPLSIEKNNLVAQHHLLKTIANKTSGKYFQLNEIEQLENNLLNDENIKIIAVEQDTYQYWIENKIWFFIIILLSLCEWIIRRWNGII